MGSEQVPERVMGTFQRLKSAHSKCLTLNRLKGKYYVYNQTSKYGKEKRGSVTVSNYLGKIREDGTFVKKGFQADVTLQQARELLESNGGKVVFPAKAAGTSDTSITRAEQELDDDDKKILMALSMNARIETPYMKRIMGIKNSNIKYRIKRLEKRFGIKYLSVVEPNKIGYEESIAFVKFKDKMPSTEEIKNDLKRIPYIQFAMLTTGAYDLLIYFLVDAKQEPKNSTISFIRDNLFTTYNSEWNISSFHRNYGYIPIRKIFFDRILNGKVWYKNKENPSLRSGQISQREYAVLRELSSDGKKEFTKIDKEYGFDIGRSQYTYHQLKDRKTIYRTTISMQDITVRYVAILHIDIINSYEFIHNGRVKLLKAIMGEKTGIINTYSLQGDILTPDSVIFFSPIINEEQLEKLKETLGNIDGTTLKIMIGRDIILGSMCYRRYDNVHNPIYNALITEYGIKYNKQQNNYEYKKPVIWNKLDIRGVRL